MTSLSISTILIVTVIAVQMQANNDCCKKKTVGSKSYTLLELTDSFPTKCKNGCIYQEDSTKDTYCFGPGDQPATCSTEEWECKDPEGKQGQIIEEDGQKYICRKTEWQPYGCPKLLDIDGIFYRFYFNALTPCAGDLSNCVYASHTQNYCMNGKYPFVTPSKIIKQGRNTTDRLPFTQIEPEVTVNFGNNLDNYGVETTPFRTINFPFIKSITLYESVYDEFSNFFGGFTYVNKTTGEEQDPIGETNVPSPCIPSVIVPVSPCATITEAFGAVGFLISNLAFGVTSSVEAPKMYRVGNTSPSRDLTPDPSKYGHCRLRKIDGTLITGNLVYALRLNQINTLTLTWTCNTDDNPHKPPKA